MFLSYENHHVNVNVTIIIKSYLLTACQRETQYSQDLGEKTLIFALFLCQLFHLS